MLFNCLNCCKAISSQTESCPYCLIETSRMVEAMTPPDITPEIKRKVSFLMKRSAYRAQKTAERTATKVSGGLSSISQVVQTFKTVK